MTLNIMVTHQIPLRIPQWVCKARHDPSRYHAIVKVASFDADFLVLLFRPYHLQSK